MNCPRAEEIDRWIGGSLEEGEAAELIAHVNDCPACAEEKDRAEHESETYQRLLSPYRLSFSSSLSSLPTTYNLKPIISFAASILVVTLLTLFLWPRKEPVLTKPTGVVTQEEKLEPRKWNLLTFWIGKPFGGTTLPETELPREEIPLAREFLERAGFWNEIEAATTERASRERPSETVRLVLSVEYDVIPLEIGMNRHGDTGFLDVRWGDRIFERDLPPDRFGAIWKAAVQLANPVQIYLDKSNYLVGESIQATFVYRGGLQDWDTTLLPADGTAGKGLVLYNKGFLEIDRNGEPLRRFTASVKADARFDKAFVRQADLRNCGETVGETRQTADFSKPGLYTVRWGCGDHRSPHLNFEIATSARPPSRLVSFTLSDGAGNTAEIRAPEEIEALDRLLQEAGFWKELDTPRNMDRPSPMPDQETITLKYSVSGDAFERSVVLLSPAGPFVQLRIDDERTGFFALSSPEAVARIVQALRPRFNPVQLYLYKSTYKVGERIEALFVYRGGLKDWDALIRTNFDSIDLFNHAVVHIHREGEGPLNLSVQYEQAQKLFDRPFVFRQPLNAFIDLSKPGRYTVQWGSNKGDKAGNGQHLSASVPFEIPSPTPHPPARPTTKRKISTGPLFDQGGNRIEKVLRVGDEFWIVAEVRPHPSMSAASSKELSIEVEAPAELPVKVLAYSLYYDRFQDCMPFSEVEKQVTDALGKGASILYTAPTCRVAWLTPDNQWKIRIDRIVERDNSVVVVATCDPHHAKSKIIVGQQHAEEVPVAIPKTKPLRVWMFSGTWAEEMYFVKPPYYEQIDPAKRAERLATLRGATVLYDPEADCRNAIAEHSLVKGTRHESRIHDMQLHQVSILYPPGGKSDFTGETYTVDRRVHVYRLSYDGGMDGGLGFEVLYDPATKKVVDLAVIPNDD